MIDNPQTDRLIHAPWSADQVTALNAFQHHGHMHPFTCSALHTSGQSPVLVATNSGWVCPDPQCVYRQDWAHAFMADEAQQQPATETRDALMRAHVALAEQAGQDQAILARVRRLYESGPLGTCCSHLVGAALSGPGRVADEGRAETPLEKRLRYSERRNDELRAECKRRGKINLEYAEKIGRLEKQLDEVRTQLGAEILRAGQAEAELRRMADEAQPQAGETPATTEAEPVSCAHCGNTIRRITGTLTAWWVHIPGGQAMCQPWQPARSTRATPKPAAGARQDGACTNCRGSGLDPRYNGEFVCPDCTTAADVRQDGAQES